jgi:hypothetical protein
VPKAAWISIWQLKEPPMSGRWGGTLTETQRTELPPPRLQHFQLCSFQNATLPKSEPKML